MNKKGLSPLVATVLLVAAMVSIGVIVATFSQQSAEKLVKEVKFMSNSVECESVRLSVKSYDITTGDITIVNRGTLGVEKVAIRKYSLTAVNTAEIDYEATPEKKLLPGAEKLDNTDPNLNKVEVIPIIKVGDEYIGCTDRISTWEP